MKYIYALIISFALLSITLAEKNVNSLKIGMLLTLSGNFESAGEDCRRGIEAALDVSKTQDLIDLVYADSKNDPKTAISEYRKLTQVDQVLAVYTHRSSIGMPLNPVAEKLKVPVIAAAGHQNYTLGSKYAFQVWPKSDEEGAFVAREFIKQGHKKAALVYTEDEWTSAIAGGFRKQLLELGGSLAFDQAVLLSERDFRTLLIKIKQKKPNAVYMNVLLPQIGPLVKQARELGIKAEYYSNFYAAKEDVIKSTDIKTMRGVKYVEADTNLPTLKAKLGSASPPPGLAIASYVGTLLIAQAAQEVKKSPSKENLYSALLRQKEVRTPDYIYPIRDRYIEFPLVVREIL